jgi:arylformamidase
LPLDDIKSKVNRKPAMWIDLTHPLHNDLPVWDESERAKISLLCEIKGDCPVRVSWLSFGAHTGTHIDAPAHFLPEGAMINSLLPDDLIGLAWVADAGDARVVDSNVLETLTIPADTTRLLVKTTNTARGLMAKPAFDKSYVGLDLSGARWLIDRKIRLIGFDYLSVQAFDAPDDTHRILLENKTILVEALDLSRVECGSYELICLPILGKGLEGAPARVVARKA